MHHLPLSVGMSITHAWKGARHLQPRADRIAMWLDDSARHADVPVVVEFQVPASLKQRMWLRSTRVRVRRVAFHVDDKTSAILLHDPTYMVGSRLAQWCHFQRKCFCVLAPLEEPWDAYTADASHPSCPVGSQDADAPDRGQYLQNGCHKHNANLGAHAGPV